MSETLFFSLHKQRINIPFQVAMPVYNKDYVPLQQHFSESEEEDHGASSYVRIRFAIVCSFVALSYLSLLGNIILSVLLLRPPTTSPSVEQSMSKYGSIHSVFPYTVTPLIDAANLQRNLSRPYIGDYDSVYNNNSDLNATDKAWDLLTIDAGAVALHDTFVAEKGLPVAQRFPWDERKGIYLLNGYHNLHCLV